MRCLNITGTAVDLAAQDAPFLPNYTVVMVNLTAGSLTVQESDAVGSGYTTLVTLEANEIAEVTFNKQYVKVSTSATVTALGN